MVRFVTSSNKKSSEKSSGTADDDKDENPDSSVPLVVPFQGNPFVILPGESNMGCKFGRNAWAASTRRKQEKKRVRVQHWYSTYCTVVHSELVPYFIYSGGFRM